MIITPVVQGPLVEAPREVAESPEKMEVLAVFVGVLTLKRNS